MSILKSVIAGIIVFSLAFLPACGNGLNTEADKDEIKYLIGMSQCNLGEPWRVVMNNDINAEALKHKDLRIIFTDAAQDNQRQIKDVEKLLSLGIDLLLISPNEAAPLTPIVDKAYHAGIPVIVIDREIKSENYTMFIGADNKDIGRQAGEFAVECLGKNGGSIIEIQGLPGSIPAIDRSVGFREIIAQYPNIKIVDTIVADWLRDKAEDELSKKLGDYDNIDLVYAHNDPMALGAYRAAQRLGIGDIMYIGIDGLPGQDGGIQMVDDGILKATFIYPTGGKEAVDYAIKILNHEENIPKRLKLESRRIIK